MAYLYHGNNSSYFSLGKGGEAILGPQKNWGGGGGGTRGVGGLNFFTLRITFSFYSYPPPPPLQRGLFLCLFFIWGGGLGEFHKTKQICSYKMPNINNFALTGKKN